MRRSRRRSTAGCCFLWKPLWKCGGVWFEGDEEQKETCPGWPGRACVLTAVLTALLVLKLTAVWWWRGGYFPACCLNGQSEGKGCCSAVSGCRTAKVSWNSSWTHGLVIGAGWDRLRSRDKCVPEQWLYYVNCNEHIATRVCLIKEHVAKVWARSLTSRLHRAPACAARVKYSLNNGLVAKRKNVLFSILIGNTTAHMHSLKAVFTESVPEEGSCRYQIFKPHHHNLLHISIIENTWFLLQSQDRPRILHGLPMCIL